MDTEEGSMRALGTVPKARLEAFRSVSVDPTPTKPEVEVTVPNTVEDPIETVPATLPLPAIRPPVTFKASGPVPEIATLLAKVTLKPAPPTARFAPGFRVPVKVLLPATVCAEKVDTSAVKS